MFAYPSLFCSPEANLPFGGGCIAYFHLAQDSLTKPSSVTPSLCCSVNNHSDLTIFPGVYFAQGKCYFYASFSIGTYGDKYYRRGPTRVKTPVPDCLDGALNLRGHVQGSFAATGSSAPWWSMSIGRSWTNNQTRFSCRMPWAGPTGGRNWGGGDDDCNRSMVDMRWYHKMTETEDRITGLQAFGNFVRTFPPFDDLSAMGGRMVNGPENTPAQGPQALLRDRPPLCGRCRPKD